MDTFNFLTEVIIPLLFFHAGSYRSCNFRFKTAYLYFLVKIALHHENTVLYVSFFKHSLSFGGSKRNLGANEISHIPRFFRCFHLCHLVIRNILFRILYPFKERFNHRTTVSLCTERIFRLCFFHIFHFGKKTVRFPDNTLNSDTGNPFRLYADQSARKLEHLLHLHDRTVTVQIIFFRFFNASVFLHNHGQISSVLTGFTDSLNRFFSSDIQIDRHMGKYNDITQSYCR